MQKYEIQIGKEWHPVRGYVNAKGWLEWKDSDGAQGLKQPGTFRARQPKKRKGNSEHSVSAMLTRRQMNAAKQHSIAVGTLVELEDGVRMWVVAQRRDCDQTPLYELSPDKDDTAVEREGFRNRSWHGGYPEYALMPIVANVA